MLRVALVGNIAGGKSAVEAILLKSGYDVLDTDAVCHNLLGCAQVQDAFEDYDVFDVGSISREKLGKLVFHNSELKTMLENILYPIVRTEIEEFFAKMHDKKFAFVAIPLLFEAGMEDLFDKIVFVYADDEVRKKRLILRNNYSPDYAQTRMDAQLGQDEKVKKSDYVIYNNSTFEELEKQVGVFLAQI